MLGRDVRLHLFSWVLVGFCYFGIYIVLLNLYLLRLGYDAAFVGRIVGLGQVAFAAGALAAGPLSRRSGSRRAMIFGISGIALGFALLPLVELIPLRLQPAWLASTYMLSFALGAIFLASGNLFLMSATSVVERRHAFSMRAALIPLAGFAGGLVGGFLPGAIAGGLSLPPDDPSAFQYSLLFGALILLPGVLALIATREVDETFHPVSKDRKPAPIGLLVIMVIIAMLWTPGLESARSFVNVYMDTDFKLATPLIGLIIAAAQLVSVSSALLAPVASARWGQIRLVVGSMLGMGLCLLVLANSAHWAAVAAAYVGVIALGAVINPSITVIQMELVPPRWQPAMSSLVTSALGISTAVLLFQSGPVLLKWGFQGFYSIGAGLVFLGGLVLWWQFRIRPGTALEPASARTPELR